MWDSPSVRACMCRHHLFEIYAFTGHHFDCYGSCCVDTLVLHSNSLPSWRCHQITGRQKAFSTCASHLTSVTLFLWHSQYDLLTTQIWLLPETKKLMSLAYFLLTLLLNPLIYSLRNSEMKRQDEIMVKKIGLTYSDCAEKARGIWSLLNGTPLNLTNDQTFRSSQHEHI